MAAELPEHAAPGSEPSDRSAARWNPHLRFALTTGLRFSAHSNDNTTIQKGDISNKLTMGTFLKSFDIEPISCSRIVLSGLYFPRHVGDAPRRRTISQSSGGTSNES